MTKLKNIKVWHKFKPQMKCWFTHEGVEHVWWFHPFETWYGSGEWFYDSFFVTIRLGKKRTLHINISWWQLKTF